MPNVEARLRPVGVLLLAREHGGPDAPSRVLTTHRYLVHIADTPAEAHRLVLQNADIGIAVIELQGETFRGTEVYAGLTQHLPHDRELACIFLARSPSVNDVVRALRMGAVDLLRKPVDPAHLIDAVSRAETALTRRATLREGAREMADLVEELRRRTAAQLDGVRHTPALGPSHRANASVEFTEMLDPQAQREDSSSLAYNQRQRRHVTAAIRSQTLRREMLGAHLVGNPCWDMLLDLHEKALLGRSVSVSSLCGVVPVPATTALRRLDDMVIAGLISRVRDSSDARRVLIQLTESGTRKLRAYFDTVGSDR